MPLSEEEQRLLDEMERGLYGDRTDVHSTQNGMRRVSSRGILWGVLGFIVGMAGVFVGVATGFFVWGLVGFVIMLAGAMAALSLREGPASGSGRGRSGSGASRSSTSKSSRAKGPSFMQRLEDRWDDRSTP